MLLPFSVLQNIQTGCVTHLSDYSAGIVLSFPGGKAAEE
jgi:hypothetical protein